jgi:hypothetical protein
LRVALEQYPGKLSNWTEPKTHHKC